MKLHRSHFLGLSALIACLCGLSCRSQGSPRETRVIENPPDIGQPTAQALPRQPATKDRAVYIFSQGNVGDEDPQVYEFPGAVLVRGWQKWDRSGMAAADYNIAYLKKVRAGGTIFVGGGTGSVLFEDEAGASFRDWATRDARNGFVPYAIGSTTMCRASLANPAYWDHLLAYCKLQIDAGVDGIFIDEANAGYQGGDKWHYNGNEGYDDYFLAGFNDYLARLHPDFEAADWERAYKMSPDNRVVKDAAPGDLARNFDYRKYLSSHGWDDWPDDPANPLASLYGRVTMNRLDPAAASYREKLIVYRWAEFVARMRDYARTTYGKELVVTSNGLFPFVDFNCLGQYEYNQDNDGKEVQWIPIKDGKLDGSVSLKAVYQKILARSRAISGDVPLVLFIDWPTKLMDSYYALSIEQKKDFWRIYGAEAYACGLYYAFHLKTAMYNEPSARQSGVLDFLKGYTKFYADHAELYTKLSPTDIEVKAPAKMTATVSGDGKRYCLHLVNHDYAGKLAAQKNFSVSFALPSIPQKVVLHSPDAEGSRPLDFSISEGKVTIGVDRLESYDCIEIE
jgi:hypothetical protein